MHAQFDFNQGSTSAKLKSAPDARPLHPDATNPPRGLCMTHQPSGGLPIAGASWDVWVCLAQLDFDPLRPVHPDG